MPLLVVLVKVENQRGQGQRYGSSVGEDAVNINQRRCKHQPGSPYSRLPSRQKLFHGVCCFVFVLQVCVRRRGPSRQSNLRVDLDLFCAFSQQRNRYKV